MTHFMIKRRVFIKLIKRFLPEQLIKILRGIKLQRQSANMKARGFATLSELLKTTNKDQTKVFCVFGTLLGLHREGNLIEHDYDIDIACYSENLIEVLDVLKILGAKFTHRFTSETNPDFGEYSFLLNGIRFDLFIFHRDNEVVFCTDYVEKDNTFMERQLVFPTFELENVIINGFQFCLPSDPSVFLAQRYGANYMQPDPSFDYRADAPCIRRTPSRGRITFL